MIYSDKLPDPEPAQMLEGLDIAEPGHWVEQLYWSWWQSWDPGSQEIEKFSILGVHDGSLNEFYHRLTTILELGMAP